MLKNFSHSTLKLYRDCPQKFKFAKVDKIQLPKRVTADQLLGSAVHLQLQKLYEWKSDGKQYQLEQILTDFDGIWETYKAQQIEITSEHMSVQDYINSGHQMLQTYYEHYQPFEQGKFLAAEQRHSFTLPNTTFRFSAIIDRLLRLPDGTIEICDYKTGKTLPRGPRDPIFAHQMALYHMAIKEAYPDFKEIEVAQYFLKHDEVIRYRMNPEELDEYVEQFKQTIFQTFQSERLENWPTNEGGFCAYCDYIDLCPAKRHRLLMENETESDKATAESAATLAGKFIELDEKIKYLKAEHTSLRSDIIRAASELDINRIYSGNDSLSITRKREDKFPTKSKDEDAYITLSRLAREFGLEECLVLDEKLLMKEIYTKGRLSEEQKKAVDPFVSEKETVFVRVSRKKPD